MFYLPHPFYLLKVWNMICPQKEQITTNKLKMSPLKSLAGDIRENLRKPLEGIGAEAPGESKAESRPGNPSIGQIQTAIRTGDTPQKERQRMVKHPPHSIFPDYGFLPVFGISARSGHNFLIRCGTDASCH